MRELVLVFVSGLLASNVAFAANSMCEAKATEKKLAGTAKNSFTKKCVVDTMK